MKFLVLSSVNKMKKMSVIDAVIFMMITACLGRLASFRFYT